MFQYTNQIFHDSNKCRYRRPLGARPAGGEVELRLYTGAVPLCGVQVVLFGEGVQQEHQACCCDGWWSVRVTLPQQAGAYWYYFALRFSGGETCYYGCKSGATAGLGEIYTTGPLCFQLTVHEAAFRTPDFFKKAVLYQIFPDRFAKASDAAEKGIEYHKSMGRKCYLHGSFEEMPLYLPLPGEEYYSPCDYFGGDLAGIEQSLQYMASLGVNVIYLNPIFEAASNHRYNTADYRRIDPVLGTEADFERFCSTAEKMGMRVILDGVFSHTGADSLYFNKEGNYPKPGAYQEEASPYDSWYSFGSSREEYKSWWGFDTLPEVEEHDAQWQEFIIHGEDSVMRHWLRKGAGGYRLDVADELPDDVIAKMRQAIREENSEAFLLGEVWEDATIKQSYGTHRKYAMGAGLDSVMNYPFRAAVCDFLLGKSDASALKRFLAAQAMNYPREMYYCLMNLLSSHDVERIRTILATGQDASNLSRENQAKFVVLPGQDQHGDALQRMAAILQFALPGMPSIYYGDETGMHGLKDPFNRGPFVIRDERLVYFYRAISKIRNSADALSVGYVSFFAVHADILGVLRFVADGKDAFGNPAENGAYLILINRGEDSCEFVVDLRDVTECLEVEQLEALERMQPVSGIGLLTGKKIEVNQMLAKVEMFGRSGEIFRLVCKSCCGTTGE